jgi:uncharacterized membrane protein
MSDLTVIGYPDEQTAARAWDELVRLENDCLADLEDAAIIRRASNGGCTSPRLPITRWPAGPSCAPR